MEWNFVEGPGGFMVTASDVGGLRLGNPKTLPIQMADDLRDRLAKQEWRQGDQLPTEADLVGEYGVSRPTVRQALKTLENQGL